MSVLTLQERERERTMPRLSACGGDWTENEMLKSSFCVPEKIWYSVVSSAK